jgi:hypothetical protein
MRLRTMSCTFARPFDGSPCPKAGLWLATVKRRVKFGRFAGYWFC